jgi:hypothetical protein
MPDIGLFFHDIGEDETCDGNIYATYGDAALEAAKCATVWNSAVLVLDD